MSVMTKDEVSEFEDDHLTTNDSSVMWMELPLVTATGLDDGVGDGGNAVVKLEEDEDMANLVQMKAAEETEDHEIDPSQLVSVVGTGGNLIRANHATLQALLSTPVSTGQVFATSGGHESNGLQVFALPQATEIVGLNTMAAAGTSASGGIATLDPRVGAEQQFVQMIPTGTDLSGLATKYIGLIAIGNSGLPGLEMVQTNETGDFATAENIATFLMPPPPPPDVANGLSGAVADRLVGDLSNLASKYGCLISQPELPPNCPSWATQLKNCEKIGDSYRGYVSNEVDLDLILTLHKQQTNSFWGTRQSPSPAKASTRLMWKSQYVPFDGIPFVNAGSRAVVMECQFGPRRKGTLGKRSAPSTVSTEFKQTCPARIYIKKVRKFPAYAVKLDQDKKSIRLAMDKAFHELREQGLDAFGEERFYVQLPTEKAHDYHDENSAQKSDSLQPQLTAQATSQAYTSHIAVPGTKLATCSASNSASVNISGVNGATGVLSEQPQQRAPSEARIHSAVLDKLRHLVAAGETKLYAIRKQLRRFVVRELFQGTGQVPERHDLTMFPTVNDLKNHIHQALKDIESGVLPVFQTPVETETGSVDQDQSPEADREVKPSMASLWAGQAGNRTTDKLGAFSLPSPSMANAGLPCSPPMPETVTVTLTQNPGEDGHHIISRIETHLSDGTTQVSTTLTPETAQLLSRLHPGLFPAGSLLQLEGASSSSSGQVSGSNLNSLPAEGTKRTQNNVSPKIPARENLLNTSTEKNTFKSGNLVETQVDHHTISGVIDDHAQQLAGLVGIDSETANTISHMISGTREADEAETLVQNVLVNQHNHSHHHPSKFKLSAQTGISSLHSEMITANPPGHMTGIVGNGSGIPTNTLVVRDGSHTSSSLPSPSMTTPGSNIAAHPLSILSAVDPAALSQIMQSGVMHSGAAQLSIVPGHPNTLALVTADSVATSLGLVAAHDPSDLDAPDGHGHLSLDTEHLMMHRPTSSLEEDHDKLAQDKMQLHITADQEIGMAKLENQVSNL